MNWANHPYSGNCNDSACFPGFLNNFGCAAVMISTLAVGPQLFFFFFSTSLSLFFFSPNLNCQLLFSLQHSNLASSLSWFSRFICRYWKMNRHTCLLSVIMCSWCVCNVDQYVSHLQRGMRVLTNEVSWLNLFSSVILRILLKVGFFHLFLCFFWMFLNFFS